MTLFPEIPNNFKRWYSAFGRIEPRCRSRNFEKGLQACTADPLWMLARQWQVGEFKGEDAGSPIQVEVTHATQAIEKLSFKNNEMSIDLNNQPLEMLVEREALPLSWRDRVQIGQTFERLINIEFSTSGVDTITRIIDWYRGNIPFNRPNEADWIEIDDSTRRFILFMEGRVVDGKPILKNRSIPPESPEIITRLATVLDELEDWCERANIYPEPDRSEAWRNEQLDYRFDLNPPDSSSDAPTHLEASDYRNGDLDWYSFSRNTPLQGNWLEHEPDTITPTKISIAGLSSRWWAFEDSNTDFGKLDPATADLTKLVLMEFALIYGDDWFSVPLPVEMSNLVNIDEFKVRDVFGIETSLDMVQKERRENPETDPLTSWEMFTLTAKGSPEKTTQSDALFIPPVSGFREESKPLEEIRFIRDEGANMVWGIEHTLLNGMGIPFNGFDSQRERKKHIVDSELRLLKQELEEINQELKRIDITPEGRSELEAQREIILINIKILEEGINKNANEVPLYRLSTSVPENWIPFIPANISSYQSDPFPEIRLLRAQMVRDVETQQPEVITANSRLLEISDDPLLWIEESNVPRSGRRTQLTAQRIRWVDGRTYVWYGRKTIVGNGEGSSGLKFDITRN